MPTYEYLCKKCSHRFEQWQKMTDEPLSICPECGGSIRRVYYPTGIVFKGSGFYKTDHNNNSSSTSSNGHPAKAEGETTAEGGSASEKKSAAPAETSSKEADSAKGEHKVTAPAPKRPARARTKNVEDVLALPRPST
jgi:putative FmdB family regulatory protein